MRRLVALSFAILATVPISAHAQKAAVDPCYAIVSPAPGVAPNAPIMIDRCTGLTWVLTKEKWPDQAASRSKDFVFRWSPIETENNEAVFHNLTVQELSQQLR